MKESEILESKINNLKSQKIKVQKVKDHLQNSKKAIKEIIEIERNNYKVNDEIAEKEFLINLYDKEDGIYNKIVNNVMPEINNRLSRLESSKRDAESKEALERR